jgi:hypothetical protein
MLHEKIEKKARIYLDTVIRNYGSGALLFIPKLEEML